MTRTALGGPADQPGNSENFQAWIRLTCNAEPEMRIGRLRQVAGAIVAGNPEIAVCIARLHDHKGHLTVMWNDKPDEAAREFVAAMWALVGNEPPESIEHFSPQWLSGADSTRELPA